MDKAIESFLAKVENQRRKEDAYTLLKLMESASGYPPYLTGTIIGYGSYHYVYESGREGDWLVTGFSPRKQNLAVYIMPGFSNYQPLMDKLGKFKTGKSCLYINKLDDIDLKVLARLVTKSVKDMQKKYVCKKCR
ncbi:DUF1801 domain-containing protein [Aliikangiella sp. G2MR2-5]|uniref:DUF1801 domain-containing protein n=1 Tax=Aliikangiella sp. G2MR2-5 TaxID=2788943 RepID=UPI0018AAC2BE|nr:DUF1801 domain-containing protein [Aliikangiella sp. G2MR2-5]